MSAFKSLLFRHAADETVPRSCRHAKAQNLALALSPLILPLLSLPAHAHAFAGDRIFPATLGIDDPSVASEVSLPTVAWAPTPIDANGNVPKETDIGGELDLLLLPNFALGISNGWTSQTARNEQGAYGFRNWEVSAKYKFFEDDEHETLMSVGLVADIGGTGAQGIGADSTSTLTPTLYFGKGMGDLPDSMALLKPFAVTGTLGFSWAQNRTEPDALSPGLSIQYSMQYLKTAVKDYELPEFVNHLIPLVEVPLSLNVDHGNSTWSGTVNPGVIYLANTWQFGVEAMIPVSGGTQHGTGVVGQFHVFLDDWLPAFAQPLLGAS